MSKVAMKSGNEKKQSRIGRFFRRLLFVVLGLIGALVLFVVLSVWLDSVFGREATQFTNQTYAAADGTELHAYLAEPEGDGPFPAVLMFHEWWGMNDDIVTMADALAAEGYVVLAPDAYRGQTTRWFPRAIWLVTQTDQEQIGQDVDAGFDQLLSMSNVDGKRIGSTGFCFGGRQSFELAKRQQEAVSATVSLYGTAYTDKAPIEALPANVPLLGIYGEEDQSIAADDVRTMDALMDEVGIEHVISIYPNVGHAFVNGDNYSDADEASGQAWLEMLAFFGEHLQGDEAGIRPNPLAKSFSASTGNSDNHLFCLVAQ